MLTPVTKSNGHTHGNIDFNSKSLKKLWNSTLVSAIDHQYVTSIFVKKYLHKKDHSMVIDGRNMIIFFECKKQILTLVSSEKR